MSFDPDFFNALWELSGGAFIALSCWQLFKDKIVRGVHWVHTGFFAAWGYWNLYYYPAIDQWWSFLGGCSVVAFNTLWLGQIIYYTRKERGARRRAGDTSASRQTDGLSPAGN